MVVNAAILENCHKIKKVYLQNTAVVAMKAGPQT